MKYKIMIGTAVLLMAAVMAFASGQQEHSVDLPGTVVSVTTGASGGVTVILSSGGKNYTVAVPAATAAKLNLQVGKEITVKGLARNDGKSETEASDIKVSSVEEDGVAHDVLIASASDGSGSGNHPTESDVHEGQDSADHSGGTSDHSSAGKDD